MLSRLTSTTMVLLVSSGITLHGNFFQGVAAAKDSFEIPSPRNLSFFSMFANEHRNTFDGRLDCVYGDPVKGSMCPPVMEDPMAHLKESPQDQNVLEIFSRCLDDPDDPECRELQVGDVSPSSNVAQAPAHLRSLFGATLSPTTDDCGGNMFDPRFCASAMPSISAAPTEDEGTTKSPSTYLIAETMEPTSCPDRQISPFVKTEGSEACPVLFSDDALPVVIEKTTTEMVTIKLANTFPAKNSLTTLAFTYPSVTGPACYSSKSLDVGAVSAPLEAKCDESGFVQIEVFAASPGFKGVQGTASLPETCDNLIKDPDPACAYILAIPCACEDDTAMPTIEGITQTPTATPTAASTPLGTQCEGRDTSVQLHLLSGKCPVTDEPIVLASRTDKMAILEVFQTWAPEVEFISALFKQNGETICASDEKISKEMTEETPLTYTVDCGPGDWATMYLYVKKTGFPSTGFVDMPPICLEQAFVKSSTDICSYKVTVSCLCNPEAPSDAPSFAPSFSPSAAPSFAPSSVPSAAPSTAPSSAPSSAPSAEIETRRIRSTVTEGAYQCSATEFGCPDGPNHVNICHYSTRTGYRTYCVPEADSEIVRFYKTDYCGACTGGYAVGETGEIS